MREKETCWPLGSYAPGRYHCKCAKCGETFEGDKRARHCLECSVWSVKEVTANYRAVNGLLHSELVGCWTAMEQVAGATYEMARAKAEARFNSMIETFHEARAERALTKQ